MKWATNILLNLVKDINEVLKPGDAIQVNGLHKKTGKRITQLIICCPHCGKRSSSRGNHIYNKETQSYYPSINHDKKYGACGWHGWLKNGIFKTC